MNENHAETALLGALLINNRGYDDISSQLSEDDFSTPEHRMVFRAIEALILSGKVADLFTVEDWLKQNCKYENGFALAASLAKEGGAHARNYSGMVKRNSIDRKILQVAQQLKQSVEEKEDGRLEKAQQAILSIAQVKSDAPSHVTNVLRDVIDDIQDRFDKGGKLSGLSSGFADIDAITMGFQPSDLIIVAARPGMGKTTFAMNIVEHAAVELKKSVLVCSLEMSRQQLVQRSLASRGRIDFEVIRLGQADNEKFQLNLSRVVEELHYSKLFIDDAPGLTVSEIRSKALKIQREGGLDLMAVDYLQLLSWSGKSENETLRISYISAALKRLAKELHIPIIALSQLNRSVEQRSEKRPLMSDLRQSGAIEQDADLIMFLYREEVYDPQSPAKGTAEVSIAKHRNGKTGAARLTFIGEQCRFADYTGEVITFQRQYEKKQQWRRGFDG